MDALREIGPRPSRPLCAAAARRCSGRSGPTERPASPGRRRLVRLGWTRCMAPYRRCRHIDWRVCSLRRQARFTLVGRCRRNDPPCRAVGRPGRPGSGDRDDGLGSGRDRHGGVGRLFARRRSRHVVHPQSGTQSGTGDSSTAAPADQDGWGEGASRWQDRVLETLWPAGDCRRCRAGRPLPVSPAAGFSPARLSASTRIRALKG